MRPRTFSPYRSQLEGLITHFALPRESLQIVDSISDYCAKLGHPQLETSKTRAAKCITSDSGAPTFLLWDHIEPSDAMLPLIARQFPEHDIQLLNDSAKFAVHQLLHEIAHFLRKDIHSTMQHGDMERDCDQWAFQQLKSLTRR